MKAPEGAPNVVIVRIDDLGFGTASAFGGPVAMPTLDRLAQGGLRVPQSGANGVILAQGGRFGGWSLYLKDGKPACTYNWLGLQQYAVASPEALPAGKAILVFDFVYDGGGLGKGGSGMLPVNGRKVAEGRIDRTQPMVFPANETAEVGIDEATPVTEDYEEGRNKFTGRIEKVTVEVK